jgi:hypothetical protein
MCEKWMPFTLSLDASAGTVKRAVEGRGRSISPENDGDSSAVKATQRNVVPTPLSDAKSNVYFAFATYNSSFNNMLCQFWDFQLFFALLPALLPRTGVYLVVRAVVRANIR